MSNDNLIKGQYSGTIQNTLAPITSAVAGSTATAFVLNPGRVTGSGGGVIPLSLGSPGGYSGTGKILRVRATGQAVATAASNLTLTLYEIPAAIVAAGLTSTTFTSWNSLGASTARAIGTTVTSCFSLQADLQLSASGRLTGAFTVEINGLLDVLAATTIVTGLTGEADMNFVLVSTYSASTTGNSVTLGAFTLEDV